MSKLSRLEKTLTPRGNAALKGYLAAFEEAAALHAEHASGALKDEARDRVHEAANRLFGIMAETRLARATETARDARDELERLNALPR